MDEIELIGGPLDGDRKQVPKGSKRYEKASMGGFLVYERMGLKDLPEGSHAVIRMDGVRRFYYRGIEKK